MKKLITALSLVNIFLFGLLVSSNVRAENVAAPSADPTIACGEQLREDARFQSLFEKMPFDIKKGQPLEVLASKAKATPKDKTALSLFTAEFERCFATGSEWRQKNYPPVVVSLMDKYRLDFLSVLADLYAGNTTFGNAAKTRVKLLNEFTSQLGTVVHDAQVLKDSTEKQRIEREAKVREEQNQRQAEKDEQSRQETIKWEQEQRQKQLARDQEQRQQQLAREQAEVAQRIEKEVACKNEKAAWDACYWPCFGSTVGSPLNVYLQCSKECSKYSTRSCP